MKKMELHFSAFLFAICACVAFAAPLYACDKAADKAEQRTAAASGEIATVVTNQGKMKVQKEKLKTSPAKKQTSSTKNAVVTQKKTKQNPAVEPSSKVKIENKKAIKKDKPHKNIADIDFKQLKERLKNTHAIGFFTKVAIRNDIVDLMDKIKQYRKHSMLKVKMDEIRNSFDGLLLKIIALLDEDPNLSRDLYVGREAIWESLLEVKV